MEHNPGPKIQIYTDSKSVEGQFNAQMARSPKRALKMTKDSQFVLWDAIRYLYHKREHTSNVDWVKSHDKDKGNNYVDVLAGKHTNLNDRRLNTFSTPTDTSKMQSLKHIPYLRKTMIESTLRQTLKTNNKIKNQIQHIQTKTFQRLGVATPHKFLRIKERQIENKWNITHSLINGATKITSTFTTFGISDHRSYMIKAMHNLLPTQSIMKQRLPAVQGSSKINCTQYNCNNLQFLNCNN